MVLSNFHSIVKETEKAICLNIDVTWSDGDRVFAKDIWFPKSCIEIENQTVAVNEAFYSKMRWEKAFHGHLFELAYTMVVTD